MNVTPDAKDALIRRLMKASAEGLSSQLLEAMPQVDGDIINEQVIMEMLIPSYNRNMSVADLESALVFWESDAGRNYKRCTAAIMRDMPRLLEELLTDLHKRGRL